MSLFLQASELARDLVAVIEGFEDTERKKAAQARALTLSIEQKTITEKLLALRQKICALLDGAADQECTDLIAVDILFEASEKLRGSFFGQERAESEEVLIKKCRAIFEKNDISDALWFRAFVILSFYFQPFELPLLKNVKDLSVNAFKAYLLFTMRQPHLMTQEDEGRYIRYYKELTSWLLDLMQKTEEGSRQNILHQAIKNKLTFGACFYVDCSTIDLIKARAAILGELVRQNPALDVLSRRKLPVRAVGRKKKLGLLSRNLKDYTDTRALYALFSGFDLRDYDIYWYSLDVVDETCRENSSFDSKISELAHKAVSLRGDAAQKAQQIIADDLDFLVIGTAYSFSAKDFDQLLALRLARVQVNLSALISGSSGLASYDYYIVSQASPEIASVYRRESTETLKTIEGPLICYERKEKVLPSKNITRAALGIPEEAVLYFSGAAVNKQMAPTLHAFLSILREVQGSYLLFAPFSPTWGGYFLALTFLARLRFVMKDFPDIDPKRIIVVHAVDPDDFERLIQLSDVCLGSFPRDGVTVAMQALHYGKPLIARAEKWLHANQDALMLRSLGQEDLIGTDNAAVAARAIRLGRDPVLRQKTAQNIAQRVEKAPFFDVKKQSSKMAALFEEMVEEKNIR
ncbi:MAG TPA: hypothetical protein DD400_01550 [Rhodospirillaceae bacterium]|nr:hypothetical protein [Rhodospirillaceae bacterium]